MAYSRMHLIVSLLVILIAASVIAVNGNAGQAGISQGGNAVGALNPFSASGASQERLSPSDWVTQESIKVYNDRVIITIPDPEWSNFTDTNSMDPIIDAGANAIEIVPKSPESLTAGNIISYEQEEGFIIHRIIRTGYDEDGWYAVVKGDNNSAPDPAKVRFSQVRRVVVAIIY